MPASHMTASREKSMYVMSLFFVWVVVGCRQADREEDGSVWCMFVCSGAACFGNWKVMSDSESIHTATHAEFTYIYTEWIICQSASMELQQNNECEHRWWRQFVHPTCLPNISFYAIMKCPDIFCAGPVRLGSVVLSEVVRLSYVRGIPIYSHSYTGIWNIWIHTATYIMYANNM